MTPLGTLRPINVRDQWTDEAKDFTPWVASPEGLNLLGVALRMDLELVQKEKPVGSYKADIVCEDSSRSDSSNSIVVIENQLATSDHRHAGQAVTYAAGLKAQCVVWIASSFRPEHLDAIAWLNRLGSSNVRFFGVEVELWQIGDSQLAPRFMVVAHPQDWDVSRPVPTSRDDPRGDFLGEYWTDLKRHLEISDCPVSLQNPGPSSTIRAAFGKTGCQLRISISVQKAQTRVVLAMTEDPEAYGHLLHRQLDAIQRELGPGIALDWRMPPDWTSTAISTSKVGWDFNNQAERQSQFEWFEEHIARFHAVFWDRVQSLVLTNYVPDQPGD